MEENSGGGASRSTDPAGGTSSATDVSLREYLGEKIHDDRRTNKERFAFLLTVGGIIWFFIERHLADLNHENARVGKISESSVSADTYQANEKQRDGDRDKLDEWRGLVDKDRQTIATIKEISSDNKLDRQRNVTSNTGILVATVAIASFILAIWTYHTFHSNIRTPTVTVTTVTVTKP